MPISWNEIRHNAVAFSKDWTGVAREDAEAKSFWEQIFKKSREETHAISP